MVVQLAGVVGAHTLLTVQLWPVGQATVLEQACGVMKVQVPALGQDCRIPVPTATSRVFTTQAVSAAGGWQLQVSGWTLAQARQLYP